MKILLAEDDAPVLAAVKELLFDGFPDLELTSAAHGCEGLLASMKGPYDVIITDFKMPIMNGLDFVSILRRCDGPNQHTPVIFLSGFVPLIQDNGSVFENVHFMEKPVQVKRFITLISLLAKRPVKRLVSV